MNELLDQLTEVYRDALRRQGWPVPDAKRVVWQQPKGAHVRQVDYATPSAMAYAREHGKPASEVVTVIVGALEKSGLVAQVEPAGPGFINVVLKRDTLTEELRQILVAGAAFGTSRDDAQRAYRVEFVSANPTGPLVIVNARAAAVGDALARILRSQGARVSTEYYVNDAGTQFEMLGRSLEARLRQAAGEDAAIPEGGYAGEYIVDLAARYVEDHGGAARALALPERERIEQLGRWAVDHYVSEQRRVLREYAVDFEVWTSEQRDVRDRGLGEKVLEELTARGLTYEKDGAVWFRSTEVAGAGDDKDSVLRRRTGELTYFAVDIAYHHYLKFAGVDALINLLGPDHHGHVPRMRAAMQVLGHAPETFQAMIVQLVTLLRDGQPVRMSKRRGEFVLMEELLEEVGRDAARFTFLTRRHDSPLEFDLAVATRQSADNPVFYVQYAHARVASLLRAAAEQGVLLPAWAEVDLTPLALPEEQALIKRLAQYPAVLAGAARAREPHRVAYFLTELAGLFHPYYKANRVLTDDAALTRARLALAVAVGQVVRNGLGLLGVSAPETMGPSKDRKESREVTR